MSNPIILITDDDTAVLNAVERDLRRKYGRDYRITKSDSGAKALEFLREIQKRNEIVALFLTDQRMPSMTGIELLEKARTIFPDAKKVLLTAYADTEAAINSINSIQLDYYLMKPWDPPEDHLYPVLDDLLEEWRANIKLPYEGIRVVGTQWSPRSHDVKDFLARHQIAYQWMDIDRDPSARSLVEQQLDGEPKIPVIFLSDGTVLIDPEIRELADRVGFKTQASLPSYDLIIIGAGPAGLAAAVYAASEGIHCLVIEKKAPGGQAGNSPKIENYLGFPTGISGMDLARRAVTQAKRFGAEIISTQTAESIRIQEPYRIVCLSDGSEVSGKAVLIATGAAFRRLEVPGVDKLTGAGVYYGAAYTEAMNYLDQPVFVVGGANSAGQGAMFLSRFASKVTMLIRRDTQWSSKYLVDAEAANPKIERMFNTEILEIRGAPGKVEEVVVINRITNQTQVLPGSAVFIFIGAQPQSELVKDLVMCNEKGFIITGSDLILDGRRPKGWLPERDPFILETSVPGIFAAGDVRLGTNHRVATATGEGGIAIAAIETYINTL
ncbi:MAG: fused response regulator/thioredoxin-disulfide reductase [Chloroflexi bacterium RBG_16_51_16]|nr:MAG: fused response regulator/thioredoxin-disulfide reductase [Chloroflexi bacterium RBG_16_51_16]